MIISGKHFETLVAFEDEFWPVVEGVARAHNFEEISGVEFLISSHGSRVVARARMSRFSDGRSKVVEHVFDDWQALTAEPLVSAMIFFATVCRQFPDALDKATEANEVQRKKRR